MAVNPKDMVRVEGSTYDVVEKLYIRTSDFRVGPSPVGEIVEIQGQLVAINKGGRALTAVYRKVPNTMASELLVIAI